MRRIGSSSGSSAPDFVTVTRSGNQKHYQARRDTPVFSELRGLIVKTVGIVEPLRRALERHTKKINAAFVYGSVAKGTDTASSDVDLLVVSSSLRYPELFQALQTAEASSPVQSNHRSSP